MLFYLTTVKLGGDMGSKERKENEKLALRRKILKAAKEILYEKGIHDLTMRAIADRIDYSPTTIYLHFNNKEELTAKICFTKS